MTEQAKNWGKADTERKILQFIINRKNLRADQILIKMPTIVLTITAVFP